MMRFATLLLFATAANSACTPCAKCTDRASQSMLGNITLRLYTGSTFDNYTTVLIGNACELLDQIDNSKPTDFYTFGWGGSPTGPIVQVVITAYVNEKDHNILLLDWSAIAAKSYSFAFNSVECIGYVFAKALDQLVACGLNTTGLNLVGHSLGAHIFGHAGRNASLTVPRITGLDPAGLGFTSTNGLNSTDAEDVQVIHSNTALYGTKLQIGDVDFYPNGGTTQPGCSAASDVTYCSHNGAPRYYAESLGNRSAFVGRACSSWAQFILGSCNSGETAIMGEAVPTTASGKYFLQTNSKSLYGRGQGGATYEL